MAVATDSQTLRLYEGRRPYPLVIGGEEVSSGESFAAIDPSTGTEWAQVAQATDANVAMMSNPPTISWFRTPDLILPGHTAMAGTRLPPSRTVPLVPRKGV